MYILPVKEKGGREEGMEGERERLCMGQRFPPPGQGRGSFRGPLRDLHPESFLSGCGWISLRQQSSKRKWVRGSYPSSSVRARIPVWPHWRKPPRRTAWRGRCNPNRGRDHFVPRDQTSLRSACSRVAHWSTFPSALLCLCDGPSLRPEISHSEIFPEIEP